MSEKCMLPLTVAELSQESLNIFRSESLVVYGILKILIT